MIRRIEDYVILTGTEVSLRLQVLKYVNDKHYELHGTPFFDMVNKQYFCQCLIKFSDKKQ